MFLDWLQERQINLVGEKDWVAYYEDVQGQGLSSTTVRNYLQSLRKFADWLVCEKHLAANPLVGVKSPQPAKKSIDHKAVKLEVAQLMIDHAETIRDKAVFMLFRDTGCRVSEAAKMTWDDIKFDDLEVNLLGKRDKPRAGYFKQPTAGILSEYRQSLTPEQQAGPVWWGKYGPLTPGGIYQIFRRTAKRIASDTTFNPHAWRHAFGREATRKGMPTAILQVILGHESIETTAIYAGADQEMARESYRHYIDDEGE